MKIEIISNEGREFTTHGKIKEISFQDNWNTLKIFIEKEKKEKREFNIFDFFEIALGKKENGEKPKIKRIRV